MPDFPSKVFSLGELESLEREIIAEAQAGSKEAVWDKLQPLRKAQHHQDEAAKFLLSAVYRRYLSIEHALDILSEVAQSHHQDVDMLAALGECLEGARDIDDLNAPPPEHAVFHAVVERLAALAKEYQGCPREERILFGLATAARMLARQRDEIAENSYRKLTEINPGKSAYHYNLCLLLKTRARFAEALKSNQTAARLVDEPDESIEWNLGICATGAGNAPVALDVWKRMGQEIGIGRFGLPEGRYPQCKVKLAERPLAERTAETDDPGLEETIWIERLSPCHGIIRSVLCDDLGVDYGDVILFDGAPITYHTYGDTKVPVFPHLATLIRRKYQFFDFAGTQDEPHQLADASSDLDEDAVVYSHSEQFQLLCANCWRDPDIDHDRHERMEKHVVIGRIAAPAHVDPAHLLDQLDRAVAKRNRCQLYAPDLCVAAGFAARASIDRRRFDLLTQN
jgi:tetratricopeptide (TPR) repeat protein